jgi:hypothetical protein
MIDFNQKIIPLTKECTEQHERMKAKGFYDSDVSGTKKWALIVSELCEAMEAERKGKVTENEVYDFVLGCEEDFEDVFKQCVKDTVSDELADVFIRCLDAIGHCNNKIECPSDILVFQSMVSNHFDKLLCFEKSISSLVYYAIQFVPFPVLGNDYRIKDYVQMMAIAIAAAKLYNIDLSKAIEAKIRYNELRGQKHGKQY